jgi:hypothetical protein
MYGEELLAHLPTPKLEDYPLSAVRYRLFTTLAAIIHIWKASPPSITEDVPCRVVRVPHDMGCQMELKI